jgi:putative oxygen-independent coproporphyrinogen III oxidase
MKIPHPEINKDSFALYVHIPFCMSKCPYCDFNSYAVDKGELVGKEVGYVDSLLRELEFQAIKLSLVGRGCSSIFFGGGTPSYLSETSILRILNKAKEVFHLKEGAEITLEANPMSFKEELSINKFIGFKEAGVNRLSFGAQSLREDKLKFLGRWHTPGDVADSVKKARECGFNNISCDYISATKLDNKTLWGDELKKILDLDTNHLSCYLLTIEPGTKFGISARKGESFICSEDEAAEIYEYTQEVLEKNGLAQYEISNYGKVNQECAHNLLYWRGGEYLGIGAGAHSFIRGNKDIYRWSNTPSPEVYKDRVLKDGFASQRLDSDEIDYDLEDVLLRLRLREGVSLTEISMLNELSDKGLLGRFYKEGMLTLEGNRVFIPRDKLIISDYIIREIVIEASR